MSSPKSKRQRILKTLLIVVAVPVTVFALLLAATPFSQIARGVMFSLVLWQDVSINHIFVFPSREIPTSTASDLPRKLDDNAKRLGLIWLGIGIVVLLVITKGFRQKTPQMSDPVGM